jgi:hypothetical protein
LNHNFLFKPEPYFHISFVIKYRDFYTGNAKKKLPETYVDSGLNLPLIPGETCRAVRTGMLRGVGGGSCEAPPYPDGQKNRPMDGLIS